IEWGDERLVAPEAGGHDAESLVASYRAARDLVPDMTLSAEVLAHRRVGDRLVIATLAEFTGTAMGAYVIGMGGVGEIQDGRLSRFIAVEPDREAILARFERETARAALPPSALAHRAAWREAVLA